MNRAQYLQYLETARSTSMGVDSCLSGVELGVAVFASRETSFEICKTLRSVIEACDRSAIIDLLVNGNAKLAASVEHCDQLASWLHGKSLLLRIWHLPLANKSHAWNTYVHAIAPEARLYLFLDGNVEINRDCFHRLDESVKEYPSALAVSGTPAVGRSSGELEFFYRNHGGLHGNLFALTTSCMTQLRKSEAILPVGLYGFDTVLGGMLGFGLDPARKRWAIKTFIVSDPGLRWRVPHKSPFRGRDVRTQIKRLQNNALRVLVRRASVHHLETKRRSLSELPVTVDAYIGQWIREDRRDFLATIISSPLALIEIFWMRDRYSSELAITQPIFIAEVPSSRQYGEIAR